MKKGILAVLFLLLITLFACGGGNGSSKVTITELKVDATTVKSEYQFDDFALSDIILNVKYSNDESKTVPVEEAMFDDANKALLGKIGKQSIEGTYEGTTFTLELNFVDYGELDKNLNPDGTYDCVVKVMRKANKLEFIVEAVPAGVNCFQMQFEYDSALLTLKNFESSSDLQGIFDADIEDGKISITIILRDALTTEAVLASISYTGDFRCLKVSETFPNATYLYVTDGTDVSYNTLYHVSKK